MATVPATPQILEGNLSTDLETLLFVSDTNMPWLCRAYFHFVHTYMYDHAHYIIYNTIERNPQFTCMYDSGVFYEHSKSPMKRLNYS